MSPEVLSEEDISPEEEKKCDVYSFAIIMYELYFERTAYRLEQISSFREHVAECQFRPEIPKIQEIENMKKGEQCYLMLMMECWHQNPNCRPSFDMIHAKLLKIAEM